MHPRIFSRSLARLYHYFGFSTIKSVTKFKHFKITKSFCCFKKFVDEYLDTEIRNRPIQRLESHIQISLLPSPCPTTSVTKEIIRLNAFKGDTMT